MSSPSFMVSTTPSGVLNSPKLLGIFLLKTVTVEGFNNKSRFIALQQSIIKTCCFSHIAGNKT